MTLTRIVDCVENMSQDEKAEHAAVNLARDVERFATQPEHDGHVCIVGGGPSLADTLDELRWRQSIGQKVWATNNTFAYLTERGIFPDAHVILDPRPENAAFLHPTEGVTYYLHATVHPSLYDKLQGNRVVLYQFRHGTTAGLRALYLAGFSGFRTFHLFGLDSSYRDGEHHAYRQSLNDGEQAHDAIVDGRRFRCAPWMLIQAEEFQQIAADLAEQGCTITVAGDGLIPWIAHRLARPRKILTAVYDLQVCPPTYDFISFLGEAEIRRQAIGAEKMDIIIQPGPLDGFRDDALPDSNDTRIGMLYRVVMGSCRLVPSIRNVEVLSERRKVVAGDVFPEGYDWRTPCHHYGSWFFRTSFPVLHSTASARKYVAAIVDHPYVTITLRQSSHWPERNSNLEQWKIVAERIHRGLGYNVVWVPDAENPLIPGIYTHVYAAYDTDMRLALYEGATLNLGVNNGPMCMLFYARARYAIWKMHTPGIPWCEPEYLTKCGMTEGIHHDGRGTIVWGTDDAAAILAQVTDCLARKDAA